MTRKERVDEAIERGDVHALLDLAAGGLCACRGAVDGEPLCACKMSSKQVRDAVSLFALRKGRLVRITGRSSPCYSVSG